MTEFTAKTILSDIEGTTTSISFVKDKLFPYAKEYTKDYLEQTWINKETSEIVRELFELPEFEVYKKEATNLGDESYDVYTVNGFVKYLIDKDLKLGPLKKLQGLVWEKGYEKGDLKGHVYPDVPEAFKRWKEAGLRLAIYSSGSIKAQQLLFGQTELGNLLPYISGHFDTTSGHKQEQQSYVNIAKALGEEPCDILFLTDVVKEAEAARKAGLQTVILARPGNAPLTDDDKTQYTVVNDFESLKIKLKESS
ncbi:enolase-phosphatase E1-like [Musca vetustissima]|uniref:enolase-phosphatase E1-like n=1 Tax=Musca vetustissima TaxID=27455 RepID=UPI002AB6F4D7|nr:enolase-phosphatase E1-like [Musca vetustissima]